MATPSKKIDAAEVLADIRAGIPDSDLMKKYKLSPAGLQSLFEKLEELGLVGIISAREFLRDMRMGMSDVDLMAKYELSAKSLGTVFDQMEHAGISIGLGKSLARGSKNTIRISELVRDIRSGLTKQQLMEKYKLTPRGFSWISAKLISSGAMSWQEIYGKLCKSYHEMAVDKPRRSQRHTPRYYVPIYASAEPKVVGRVRDISQQGIGTRGIRAEVGLTNTLVIPADNFGEWGTIIFEARCAWTSKDSIGEYLSGFEVIDAAAGSRRELQLLIELSSLKLHA